jgi:hypothetical protein
MGRAMSEGGEIIVKPIVDGFVGEITGLDLASGLGARTKSLLSCLTSARMEQTNGIT